MPTTLDPLIAETPPTPAPTAATIYDPSVPDRLLTVLEAAAWLNVSRRTLYCWMQSGKLSYLLLPSGRRRLSARALLQLSSSLEAGRG